MKAQSQPHGPRRAFLVAPGGIGENDLVTSTNDIRVRVRLTDGVQITRWRPRFSTGFCASICPMVESGPNGPASGFSASTSAGATFLRPIFFREEPTGASPPP